MSYQFPKDFIEPIRNSLDSFLLRAEGRPSIPWFLFVCALLTLFLGAYVGRNRQQDDGVTTQSMAENILQGKGMKDNSTSFGPAYSHYPPGLGIIRAAFMKIFNHSELALIFFFILLTAFSKVLFFYLARRLLPFTGALLAALLWVFYPPSWFHGSRINQHTYTTDFQVVALYLLFLAWDKKSRLLGALVGFICGTMAMMRGEYVYVVFILAALSLLALPRRMDGFKFAASMVFGWMLVMGPWVLRNYHLHGRFLLSYTYSPLVLWMTINPDYQFTGDAIPLTEDLRQKLSQEPNEIGKMDIVKRDLIKRIKENPIILLRTTFGNFFNFWRIWLSPKAVALWENIIYVASYFPIFILFIWGAWKVPFKEIHWMTIGSLLAYRIAIHTVTYFCVHFREAAMPLMILIAAYSIVKDKFSPQIQPQK